MTHVARLAMLCACLVVAALAVPRFAPQLMATYLGSDRAAPTTPAAARLHGPGPRTVTIAAGDGGHYVATAEIEGRSVPVVIDTGATVVALTTDTAHRLGIRLTPSDFTAEVTTANGVVAAAPVMVDDIDVGGIEVRDVAAVVVAGDTLGIDLLGMSFLNRLTKFEAGGGQLVLTE